MEERPMREKPILFSSEMVRAILDKRKTQTLRVIKPQPANGCHYAITVSRHGACHLHTESFNAKNFDRCYVPPRPNFASHVLPCPYGKPGDRLWVRETWNFISDEIVVPAYRADDETQIGKWKSPILMPREASRILLENQEIRCMQVQQINKQDVYAEGIIVREQKSIDIPDGVLAIDGCLYLSWLQAFKSFWNKLNAKRGFSYDNNPWVWVIKFKKL